ncbi:putative 5' nucleotidase [Ixodes scapularis]
MWYWAKTLRDKAKAGSRIADAVVRRATRRIGAPPLGVARSQDRYGDGCYGGVARLVTKVKELKNKTKHSFFFNGGDFFQGTVWYTVLKYNIVAEAMSRMMYDSVCLGNHEFDDGPEGLAPFLKRMVDANVTVLGTNLDTSKEPLLNGTDLKKSIIYEVEKLKVGVMGVVTKETMQIARPADARSHPSQCGVEGVSCDIELPLSPRPTGRSRDFLPALDRLGWLVPSTALGLKAREQVYWHLESSLQRLHALNEDSTTCLEIFQSLGHELNCVPNGNDTTGFMLSLEACGSMKAPGTPDPEERAGRCAYCETSLKTSTAGSLLGTHVSSGPSVACSSHGRGLLAGAGRSCCKSEFALAGFARENLVCEVVLQDAEVYALASGWIHPCARTDQSKTAYHEVGHDVPRQAILADERLVITFCDNGDAVLSTKERFPSIIRI